MTTDREYDRQGGDNDRRDLQHHNSHRRKHDSPGGVPQWVLITVILVVTSAWLANFLISVFNSDYHPPGTVNTAFITIVGTILVNAAARYRGTKNDDNNNQNDQSDSQPNPPRPRPRLEGDEDRYYNGDGDRRR